MRPCDAKPLIGQRSPVNQPMNRFLPEARPFTVLRLAAGLLALFAATGCLQTTFGPEPVLDVQAVDVANKDLPGVKDASDTLGDAADVADSAVLDEAALPDAADVPALPDAGDAQTEIDAAPVLLPLGHTCTTNAGCLSKQCVPLGGGTKICSQTCNGDCPAGSGTRCGVISGAGAPTGHFCLPLPGGLCQSCTLDSDCQSGACLTGSDGANYCSAACDSALCPVGFGCEATPKGQRCVPDAGTCTCGAGNKGKSWGCSLENQYGSCNGVQSCAFNGWSLCNATPASAELCDGLDNNCDGKTDETFPGLGQPCGLGVCAGGKYLCGSDKTKPLYTCSTDGKKAKKETCFDDLDNDCNGVTDDGCPPKDTDGDGTPDLQDCAPYAAETHPGAKEPCCQLMPQAASKMLVPATAATTACDRNCDFMVFACLIGDNDGDGFAVPDDCDDFDPLIHPGAVEKCGDGIDQDCDGKDLTCDPSLDQDADGYMVPDDCDDTAPKVHPGALELCNKVDDNCDGVTDEGNPGGGGSCGKSTGACKPGVLVCNHMGLSVAVTCTDAVLGSPETCNGIDDDCNGKTDEGFAGLGTPCDSDDSDLCANGVMSCAQNGQDTLCIETKLDLVETCALDGGPNGVDENCNGQVDETCSNNDVDGDGFPAGTDCNDLDSATHPGAEEPCCAPTLGTTGKAAMDACDRNCDGVVKSCDPTDLDLDGHTGAQDCNEKDPHTFVGAPEKCGDGIDQDCDGTDLSCDAIANSDDDGDGYANEQDCKPFDAAIHPWAPELCNGKDDNCNGIVDEGNPEAKIGPCGSQLGLCKPGTDACVHVGYKAMLACTPVVGPAPEECDGLDNNCNGKTDEYFLLLGQPCDGPDSDKCKNGVYTCAPDGSGAVCASESVIDIPEVCDGIDNNCNGLTDEGLTYYGQQIGDVCKGQGACGSGVVECSPELQIAVCSTDAWGSDAQSQVEICDGIDNDCDGFTDEGMLYGTLPIGAACEGPGGCAGKAGVVECAAGGLGVTCSTSFGGSNYQGSKEVCDGIDNNCNGHIDEGLTLADSTCKQKGICSPETVKGTCFQGKWACDYSAVSGYQGDTETTCDGIDNDCNGLTDDAWGVGLACDGPDTDLCKNGVILCGADGASGVCGPETITDIVEICNGIDDNCDGVTDEGWLTGQPCDGPDSDSCKNGTYTCTADGLGNECVNESKVNLTELCNGLDDDCNGQTDETFPGLGEACDGPDSDQCKHGILGCSADGLTSECGPENPANIVETCDGIDNDCNGLTDDGLLYQGAGVGAPCKGIGACGEGTVVCSPTQAVATCSTNPNAFLTWDVKEICDGLDNDCNGVTDEGLTFQGVELGGVCGPVGVCGTGVVVCGSGKTATCSTWPDGTKPQGSKEICDTLDNDCNGLTDENLGLADSPCMKTGACATGTQSQCSGGVWSCFYDNVPQYQQIETICDGIDNDCDGQTDEGYDVGVACDGPDSDLCKTGTKTCTADGIATECVNETLTNIPEVCDGKDNDCNGQTDEGFTYLGMPLGSNCLGKGVCGPGTVVCGKNLTATCSTSGDGPDSQASPEVCDFMDNDCDGVTDNGMTYLGVKVGQTCVGYGECGIGTVVCTAAKKAACTTNPDGTTPKNKPEVCNNKDDDCDGITDDNLDLKKAPCNKVGVCAQAETAACLKGVWKCTYSGFGFEPKETLCDELDNDCNGLTDEPFTQKGQACDGPDADLCKNGLLVCSDTQKALICGPETPADTTEMCDFKDNNCNGLTDEGFNLGMACDGPDTDFCKNGTFTCAADGLSSECVNEVYVNIQEVCDGKDNNCDGQTDEGFGVGAPCDGPDTDFCKNGVATCDGTGGVTCVETITNIPEICNGLDDNCNGVTDEGFEEKGTKCDALTDDDTCQTGIWQCGTAGEIKCVGDIPCVIGTTCKWNLDPKTPDQCMCGTGSVCSNAQGDSCVSGACTCQGKPPCGAGLICGVSGCQ